MTEHLVALQTRLSHENGYLAAAKSANEIALRTVWIAQIEKEIAAEIEFLAKKGIVIEATSNVEMSDDELLAELMA